MICYESYDIYNLSLSLYIYISYIEGRDHRYTGRTYKDPNHAVKNMSPEFVCAGDESRVANEDRAHAYLIEHSKPPPQDDSLLASKAKSKAVPPPREKDRGRDVTSLG
jgi:hypothetical protein